MDLTMQINTDNIILLKDLTTEEANKISKYATLIEKNKGEPIVVTNDRVPGIFTVVSGEVGVYITESLLNKLVVGESFGEMSYLEGTPASATLRALTDKTKLVLFTKEAFETLNNKESKIATKIHIGIARSLSSKLRKTNDKINDALAEISNDIEVSNIQTSLSSNYKKLRHSSVELADKVKNLEELNSISDEPLDHRKLKTYLLTIGDQLDVLFDRVAVMGKGVEHLDDAAKKLNEVRSFFFGKSARK